MLTRRLWTAVIGLLASLAGAAPADAFTPPTLYVRLAHANSTDHTPASDWMPLSASPVLNWMGGYQIGYAFEDAPGAGHSQHAALTVTRVPDGHPTQPFNTPYCLGGPGTVGAIVPAGVEIQFEGNGSYGVTVSVGPSTGGRNDCMAGPGTASSTGSFTVDVRVAPAVIGHPLAFRAKPFADSRFVGVRAAAPPGGGADTRCARDATIRPDGAVTGRLVVPAAADVPRSELFERDFVRPGAWTCVARGSVEGSDANLNALVFATQWSPPLRLDVRSDFRRSTSGISKPRSKHPLLRFTAEFPEAARGGTGRFELRRLVRCRGAHSVFKTVGTFKGRFDGKGRATVRVSRPPMGYYIGIVSFSGTRFYTRSVDPNEVPLGVSLDGALSFISPLTFPQCPGFR